MIDFFFLNMELNVWSKLIKWIVNLFVHYVSFIFRLTPSLFKVHVVLNTWHRWNSCAYCIYSLWFESVTGNLVNSLTTYIVLNTRPDENAAHISFW